MISKLLIPIRFQSTRLKPSSLINDFTSTKLIHGNTNLHMGITKRASDKLNLITKDEPNPMESALKIQVESGGCHGFQYNLGITNTIKELSKNKELLIFERDNGRIILDESSLTILQDSKLDYTKELIGSQFKIIDSPYTSTACGCGASFDFDFEKLEKKNATA
ncbi:unnamed protein product [Candida verbasci]|uniref:Core domain-containing protein n=1 Tax=Candida verbasci TaxID=1227364 RepID=A0A9W4TYS0_9ASCO|nr:unnamed protein product [Candida verbasci]